MSNEINDLLNEIEKFRSNIAQSNALIDMLKLVSERLDSQAAVLEKEHKDIIDQIESKLEETAGLHNQLQQSVQKIQKDQKTHLFLLSGSLIFLLINMIFLLLIYSTLIVTG